jgi:GntR family transcriptional regulator
MANIQIDKSENLSIQSQLVEQLKYHIDLGTWRPEERLPTVRELAMALRLNYNTIRAAYQELERQGYLVTEQGRGTFVSPRLPRLPLDRQAALLELIDEALLKAQALGISHEEFARTAYARAKLLSHREGAKPRLLFAECNRPDLAHYGQTIAAGVGVTPETFLVEELAGRTPAFFDQFDLITTTLFHVTELQEMVGPARKVLGLMVNPEYFEVITEMSRMPQGTPVGLICTEQAGAEQMAQALRGVGADYLTFLTAGLDQPEQIEQLFQAAQRVYVSRWASSETPLLPWPDPERVREYLDDIDPAALRLLRQEIVRWRGEEGAKGGQES